MAKVTKISDCQVLSIHVELSLCQNLELTTVMEPDCKQEDTVINKETHVRIRLE